MAVREYIGARYVPIFDGAWDNTKAYEPLTVVEYQGNSYTSRQAVPVGIAISNEQYWVQTGNYSAQIEAYRQEVQAYNNRIATLEGKFPVTASDIADNTITYQQLATGAVTGRTIENEAVTATKIGTGAITNTKIAETAVHYEQLNASLRAAIDQIGEQANESCLHKNIICIGDSFGRGTGAGENGAPNDKGWPYYINEYLKPSFFLNCSNSAAGFVKAGHTAPYNGMNFQQQIDYAYANQLEGTSPNAIDYVIIAGGVNDASQDNRINAAYNLVRHLQSLFPNAQIFYFPLASGKMVMDVAHYNCFGELCYGCAEGGAQVYNEALYWLYPFQERASYAGDKLHPNQQGYQFIGAFMSASLYGKYVPAQVWSSSTYPGTDGLQVDEGVINTSFKAEIQNGFAWFGGIFKKTGTGGFATLPSFCRPENTMQWIAFAYADSNHRGPVRMSLNAAGRLLVQTFINQSDYDATLEYTYYIMPQFLPLGHFI